MRLTLIIALFCSITTFAKPGSLCFLENKGQVKDQFYNSRTDIQFSVQGSGMTLFIGNGRLHYQFAKPIGQIKFDHLEKDHQPINWDTYRLDMELLNANQLAEVIAEDKQEYYENHFIPGNYNTLIAHTYKKITYRNIYPYIDWILYINGEKLKHEFIVHEGGDPDNIRMKYSGASQSGINADGSFYAVTPLGTISEDAPYSYTVNGDVSSNYLVNNDILSFDLGSYSGKLIIDPTLTWLHTLPTTTAIDKNTGITHSNSSSVYACGWTAINSNLATIGAHQYTYAGDDDGFVTKINNSGNTVWATYYGGPQQDYLHKITFDQSSGHIYAVGQSWSTVNIGTPGTQEPTSPSGSDGFIVKFDSNGARIWGTYINEPNFCSGYGASNAVTTDNNGFIYVAGCAGDQNMATSGTYQTSLSGISDALISKYNSSGFRVWSTYFGGNVSDRADGITYKDGQLAITGLTNSTSGLASLNAYQTANSGLSDAFLAKFDTTGNILWATYFGQANDDWGRSIVFLNNADIVFGGWTYSTNMATIGSHQETFGGVVDGFITRFSTTGNLLWSTYYGGSQDEYLFGVTHDPVTDNIMAAGYSFSDNNIGSPSGYQEFPGSLNGGFMTRFTSDGTRLWGSYLHNNNYFVDLYSIHYSTDHSFYVVGSDHFSNNGNPAVYKFYDCQKPILSGSISGEDTVCAFSPQAYSGSTALEYDNYAWILPNTWAGNSNTNTINAIAGSVSDSIYFYAANTCGSSDTLSMYVLVNDPEATITISGFDLSTTTTFNTYQWYQNGVSITNAISQSYTATQDGDYYVIVTDAFGCADTSNTIHAAVSVNEINKEKVIAKIYPNPAANELTIEGKVESATIFSSDGKKIAGYQKFNKQTIDISSFGQGVYFIRVENPEGKQTLKFTKK